MANLQEPKVHLIPKGYVSALCNSKVRTEGGRLAVNTAAEFKKIEPHAQCTKCAAVIARIRR